MRSNQIIRSEPACTSQQAQLLPWLDINSATKNNSTMQERPHQVGHDDGAAVRGGGEGHHGAQPRAVAHVQVPVVRPGDDQLVRARRRCRCRRCWGGGGGGAAAAPRGLPLGRRQRGSGGGGGGVGAAPLPHGYDRGVEGGGRCRVGRPYRASRRPCAWCVRPTQTCFCPSGATGRSPAHRANACCSARLHRASVLGGSMAVVDAAPQAWGRSGCNKTHVQRAGGRLHARSLGCMGLLGGAAFVAGGGLKAAAQAADRSPAPPCSAAPDTCNHV